MNVLRKVYRRQITKAYINMKFVEGCVILSEVRHELFRRVDHRRDVLR